MTSYTPKPFKNITYLAFACITLIGVVWLSGLDNTLATTLYNPANKLAWLVREWSNTAPLFISIGLLFFLAIPPLRDKSPLLRYTAVVWVLVAILGVALLNQVILKNTFERPRPREAVLIENLENTPTGPYSSLRPTVALKGNSMPSGHAGLAFLWIIPFFTLRKRAKRTAYAFLAFGLIYGSTVGLARMTLGAHFLSDIIAALSINLILALLFARLFNENTPIKTRYPALFVAVASFCMIWFNKFETTLYWQSSTENTPHPFPTVTLPCTPTETPRTPNTPPKKIQSLTVHLKGYGAPTTHVYLRHNPQNNTLSIQKFGLFRNFSCTATIQKSEA